MNSWRRSAGSELTPITLLLLSSVTLNPLAQRASIPLVMRLIKTLALLPLMSMLLPTLNAQSGFTGRWNFTGTGEHADRVYWLEITEANGALSGMFLNRTGSPVVLETVKMEDGQLVFQMRAGRGDATPNKVRLEGGKLVGTIMDRGTAVAVTGVRPPKFPSANAN